MRPKRSLKQLSEKQSTAKKQRAAKKANAGKPYELPFGGPDGIDARSFVAACPQPGVFICTAPDGKVIDNVATKPKPTYSRFAPDAYRVEFDQIPHADRRADPETKETKCMQLVPAAEDMDLTYGYHDDGQTELLDAVVVYPDPKRQPRDAVLWARSVWGDLEVLGCPLR